jgi:predicted nucleic acid-binding protein
VANELPIYTCNPTDFNEIDSLEVIAVTAVVCDASVVLKWFVAEDEPEVDAARTLLAAHTAGVLHALVLDLMFYEIGNVLARSLGWTGEAVTAQLDDLEIVCPDAMPLAPAVRADAARLSATHGLSFYDAAYWATARTLGVPLVTTDSELLAAGAGSSPAAFMAEH